MSQLTPYIADLHPENVLLALPGIEMMSRNDTLPSGWVDLLNDLINIETIVPPSHLLTCQNT